MNLIPPNFFKKSCLSKNLFGVSTVMKTVDLLELISLVRGQKDHLVAIRVSLDE